MLVLPMIKFLTKNEKFRRTFPKEVYLFQNFLECLSNFNNHLLRNLMTIHIKKCATERTKSRSSK